MIRVQLLSWFSWFAPFALIPLGLVTFIANTPSCIWVVIHIMNYDKHFVSILCVIFKLTGATVCTFLSLVFLSSSINFSGQPSFTVYLFKRFCKHRAYFLWLHKRPQLFHMSAQLLLLFSSIFCYNTFLLFLWVFLIAWRRNLKPSNSKAKCSGFPLPSWTTMATGKTNTWVRENKNFTDSHFTKWK